jgi:hypothetical protein
MTWERKLLSLYLFRMENHEHRPFSYFQIVYLLNDAQIEHKITTPYNQQTCLIPVNLPFNLP